MPTFADQCGVLGVLVVDEETNSGNLIYLRFDPGAHETTSWNESCLAAFNDARAALAAILQAPLPTKTCFYAIDWQEFKTKTNVYIEGRSLTLAAALAMVSYYCRIPIADVLCTGDLAQDGNVMPVDVAGLKTKLRFLGSPAAAAFARLILPKVSATGEVQVPRFKVHCVENLKEALQILNPAGQPLKVFSPDDAGRADDPRALLARAWVDLAANDADAAIEKCDKAIQLDSCDSNAWFLKGMALLRKGVTEKNLPGALLSLSTRWNDVLDHQSRDVPVSARACLKEACRLSPEYKARISSDVCGTWAALSDECVRMIKDSIPSAMNPEHIDLLQKMLERIQRILTALKKQRHWFDSDERLSGVVSGWMDALDKAGYRYRQLRSVDRDVHLELALNRVSSFTPSIPKIAPRGAAYVAGGAVLIVALSAGTSFFIPILTLTLILAAAAFVMWYANDRPSRPVSPIHDALWMKHGKKRGIDFMPAATGPSLEQTCDRIEAIVQCIDPDA